MSIPVILDMDNAAGIPGRDVDDALALALALASPEISLVGCTACAGNCRTHESARNTAHQLFLAGREDIPVAAGREEPFLRDRSAHFRHMEQPLSGQEAAFWRAMPAPPAQVPPLSPLKAHELIIEKAREYPGELVVVMVGSLTNLALALLAEPGIAPLIREVIHMGGAYRDDDIRWEDSTPDIPPEVWRDTLRFNPLHDPEASLMVFRSGVPVIVVPANVTMNVFLRPGELEPLRESQSAFHRHLFSCCEPWIEWSRACRRLEGMHLHDPLALALSFLPHLCCTRPMRVDEAVLLAPDGTFLTDSGDGPEVRVACNVQRRHFESILRKRIKK
ncbi:nucleoside hydrolase [Salidesulfovibrio onnuriiensis]|uniref:nucleoside hydrolase n=1 Tax=Salidesulfovibrio onnuriiensis TaxID=2583823 RepID=UPI001650B3F6|nr:nucleoside hydrolase [Salidesulfovibrio onnuriiensis]